MKDCADIGAELGLGIRRDSFPAECCYSCHADRDGGEPMIDAIEGAEVCCAIWRLYDDRKGITGVGQETQA